MKQMTLFDGISQDILYPLTEKANDITSLESGRGASFVNVQRQFEKTGTFSFTGGDRIRSPRDVAYIFKCLETAAVENAFAVMVKDGRPTVIHLGMGTPTSTQVYMQAIVAADLKLSPDKVYFIHNHPSGSLGNSMEDCMTWRNLRKYLGDRLEPGIIINTRSGKFLLFDESGPVEDPQYRPEKVEGEIPVGVYSFSRQVFAKDYVESGKLKCVEDVASFLSGQRLGERDKFSYLVIGSDESVTANIHTHYSNIRKDDIDEIARKMWQDVSLFGGKSVIAYGSADIGKQVLKQLQERVEQLTVRDMHLLDFVKVTPALDIIDNENQVRYKYQSMYWDDMVTLSRSKDKEKKELPVMAAEEKHVEKDKRDSSVIQDFGEKIEGARKDMMQELASTISNVTISSLVEHPLSKVWKKPDLKKMVDQKLVSPEEARILEAVIQYYILRPKPRLTKKEVSRAKILGTKTHLDRWAQSVYDGMEKLYHVFACQDKSERSEAIQALIAESPGNPDKINPIALIDSVLRQIDYKAGDSFILPRVDVREEEDGTVYILKKDGNIDYNLHQHPNWESAVDRMVQVAKLQRGDQDVVFSEKDFIISGIDPVYVESNRWSVVFSRNIKGRADNRIFQSEEEARAFLSAIEKEGGYGKASAIRDFAGYRGYAISLRNVLDREIVRLPKQYPSEDEARRALQIDFASINQEANRVLNGNMIKRNSDADSSLQLSVFIRHKNGKKIGFLAGISAKDSPTGKLMTFGPVFETYLQASDWIKENRDDIVAKLDNYKAKRKQVVFFQEGSDDRIGPDYRKGKDVTPEMFTEAFGFRGVQFGNWTNGKDRQAALNSTYDALMDLAGIIGKDSRAISLNGELALAFGSRGSGSANAHYEMNKVVINLTKTRGAGSLAHEWWHAVDNYFARRMDNPLGFITVNSKGDGVRSEVKSAFDSMVMSIGKSDYGKRSSQMSAYWRRTEEVTARFFAEWVSFELEKKGHRNHFLSRGVDSEAVKTIRQINYELYSMGQDPESLLSYDDFVKRPESLFGLPYPVTEEIEKVGGLMSDVFQTIQEKVDEKTGKTLLFRDGIPSERTLEEINAKFNEELQRQVEGSLPGGHIYWLGYPGDILLSTGILDLPIELASARLSEKANAVHHPFTLDDVKNLPEELQRPVAIFQYGDKNKAQNLVIQIEKDEKNFIIGMFIRPTHKGKILEINSIRGIYPKDTGEWLNWISQGKLLYVDKEKIQALIDKQRRTLADVEYLNLDSVTKILKNFKNPSLKEGKIVGNIHDLGNTLNTDIRVVRSTEVRHEDEDTERRMREAKGKWRYETHGTNAQVTGEVNERFNAELERFTIDSADNFIFKLGMPSDALLSGGVENKPIKLYGSKVAKKMRKHGFKASDLKNLPLAVANPIAVFNNTGRQGNRSVFTELKTEQGNILITLDLGKGMDADFDIVSSVFGKAGNSIVHWINNGFVTYMDKEKALNYLHLSAPIAEASNSQELSHATKIVKNFKNPTLEEGKIIETVQEQGDTLNTDIRIMKASEIRHADEDTERRMRGAKGWYDVKKDQVVIILDNIRDEEDAKKTILHEVVAHKGLRKTLGEKAFGVFCKSVFASMPENTRNAYLARYKDPLVAGEEFVARMAEQDAPASVWSRISSSLKVALNSIGIKVSYSDGEVRALLRRSYRKLEQGKVRSEPVRKQPGKVRKNSFKL